MQAVCKGRCVYSFLKSEARHFGDSVEEHRKSNRIRRLKELDDLDFDIFTYNDSEIYLQFFRRSPEGHEYDETFDTALCKKAIENYIRERKK